MNNKELIKCKDCQNSILHIWPKDPVIAECKIRQIRHVAESIRHCAYFAYRNKLSEQDIIKHNSRYG